MKTLVVTVLFFTLALMSLGASPAAAVVSQYDCVAAATSYATTIAACSTAVACWVLDPATLGLGTWACIAASIACLGSIPADVNYGGKCMDFLEHQAQITCEANGGYALWDSYSNTYICMPQFEGSPPGWAGDGNDLQQIESGGGGGGGGWWGGGWGYVPGGSVQLWCCYTVGSSRICNPC